MAGKIIDVVNQGTIVLVLLLTDDQRIIDVAFDHRCFQWLLQGECCQPGELIGRDATYQDGCLAFTE